MKAWRRWWRRRRQVRRGPIVLATVCTVLAILPSAFAATSYREINSVASWLAMREVRVLCLTPEESVDLELEGVVAYVSGMYDTKGRWRPGNTATFSYGNCEALLAIRAGDASRFTITQQSWAVLALAHEAGHLRGHRWGEKEDTTQCWAMRHFRYTAQRLRAPNVDELYAEAYAIHHRLPVQYQLPTCRLPERDR